MSLNELVDIIEQLSKEDQIQILRFMIKHDIVCNENNNGVYINLSNVADDKIDLLEKLVDSLKKLTGA